ncbi:MAG: hypothetical protein K6E51_12170 [Treponema sp.]|nr:hypothetical protein [Treponema sp.]
MNTIPSIFNERQINRTVLGGTESMPLVKMNISVVLINTNGSHFRIQMIENLSKCGFVSIVSLELNPENYNIEDFATKFPYVKFIVPLESVTDGDLINIGISESTGDYVLVLRDTLRIPPAILTPNLAEHLIANNTFCIVPRMVTKEKQGLPIQFIPSAEKSKLHISVSTSVADGVKTLYPFDYIGLYNRQKFIQLGGFDYTIVSPYWQNLDFAFRAWIWGEEIRISTAFQMEYAGDVPVEDSTVDQSYTRFYMKNLLPRFHLDHGIVPIMSFFIFLQKASYGIFECRKLFSDLRRWVHMNQYRFKKDAVMLIEEWDIEK